MYLQSSGVWHEAIIKAAQKEDLFAVQMCWKGRPLAGHLEDAKISDNTSWHELALILAAVLQGFVSSIGIKSRLCIIMRTTFSAAAD